MKIAIVLGTRPEAVKMAPLIQLLREQSSVSLTVISTGQHKQMLQQIVEWFEINVDIDLDLMLANQSLAGLSSRCLTSLNQIFNDHPFDFVFVQGDTTTAFIASLAAFYNKIPVAHIEAGLRTYNKLSPWPEEINRGLITTIATYHFAPTQSGQDNLIKEGIKADSIWVTGNTVIDALLYTAGKVDKHNIHSEALHDLFTDAMANRKIVLITGHRRESFGNGFKSICKALHNAARNNPDVIFVYPVHLNPNVRQEVMPILSGVSNIRLIDPLSYPEFVSLMKRCYFILTDSGGVQEEAPSLGKPVLVMRENTERPEGVVAGAVKLVGTSSAQIEKGIHELLTNPISYQTMSAVANPYGDGYAAKRIMDCILNNVRR